MQERNLFSILIFMLIAFCIAWYCFKTQQRITINEQINEFGQPLEYAKQPEYFDAVHTGEDTDVMNSAIQEILKKNNVKTVLDLTCGTGSQVLFLAQFGYQVVGSDLSPALIKIAQKKAQKENINVRFLVGDMCTTKVGKFDAVISILNAIGHLKKADFKVALKNVCDNLKSGGLYLFDIANLQAMTDEVVQRGTLDIQNSIENAKIQVIRKFSLDRTVGLLTFNDDYTVYKNSQIPQKFYNKFVLQIYDFKELREMLEGAGFKIIELYDLDGSSFIPERSLSILTVAKKIRD